MEKKIKDILKTSTFKPTGQCGGGCINQGESYITDHGKVFVKLNFKDGAKQMFEGEFASLEAIRATGAIRAPKPLHVVANNGNGAALVMEALDMGSSSRKQKELGIRMAKMHDHNRILLEKGHPSAVEKFGFHITTNCGFLPMDNSWKDDWIEFFDKNRIEPQIRMLEEKSPQKEVRDLWSKLQKKLPGYFQGIEIVPALLHGDLWSGNKAELANEPVVFDPACFYGHSEFEFGIIQMFGGFNSDFFQGYHSVLPKQEGFEKRCDLYELFHQLNHWNHFGTGYRRPTIDLLKRMTK